MIAVKDGIKTIINPESPRDGRYIAKLTEEITCGGEGSPPAGVLNKPMGFPLPVDDQGNIYVWDYGDVNIKLYDSQGHFIRAIGRQGQGPGEFSEAIDFCLITGNRICVLDLLQNRISILNAEGRCLSGYPLKGYFRSLMGDGRDRLFLLQSKAIKEPENLSTEFLGVPYLTSIFRTDVTGKEFVHVMDVLGESRVRRALAGGGVETGGGGYSIVWTISPQGKIYGACNADYSIGVFGEDGKKELVFGRQFTPLKNPRFKGLVGQKPNMPAFRWFTLDEDSNIWVQVFQPENAPGFLYDVFSQDGTYIRQVSIEQRIRTFKNGKIYCVLSPEEGYPSIKRYKIELVRRGK